MKAIEITGLRKSFGRQVVQDVDLEVGAGSVFALLGPNGAGKTTLINIGATLLAADAGQLGSPVTTWLLIRRRCAGRSASPGNTPGSTRC